jgi:hypothetical protein
MSDISDLQLTLPVADKYPIVLITGDALRHDRFAMRVQAEFSNHVVAWWQVASRDQQIRKNQRSLRKSAKKARVLVSQLVTAESNGSLGRVLDSVLTRLRSKPSLQSAEQRLFGKEVDKLRNTCTVRPTRVESLESDSALSQIKSLKPYFILVFGHAICIPPLRDYTEGLVVSQSDAWTPEFEASFPVYWALYHRDLPKIASTIHFLRDGAESDIVVRSSTPCLAVDDTAESCFARQAAVGTELMCELVGNLIKNRTVRFDQHQPQASLPMNTEPTEDIRQEVERDLRRGLIKREISRKRAF